MKCEDCLKVIEEYFDSELSEAEASLVSAHLGHCEPCTRRLDVLGQERNLYALYRREVEVTPALWSGVAARIRSAEAEKQSASLVTRLKEGITAIFGTPRLSPALTFALVILAVGATAGLMKYMQSEPQVALNQPAAQKGANAPAPAKEKDTLPLASKDSGGEADAIVEEPTASKEEPPYKPARVLAVADGNENRRSATRPGFYTDGESPERLVREAEQKYMAAIAMLSRDTKRRRTLLEPDVRARFDQTLAAVDRTIAETRRAARRQPDDPLAVQYMLAAYAKKVEVLKEVATYRADDDDIQ